MKKITFLLVFITLLGKFYSQSSDVKMESKRTTETQIKNSNPVVKNSLNIAGKNNSQQTNLRDKVQGILQVSSNNNSTEETLADITTCTSTDIITKYSAASTSKVYSNSIHSSCASQKIFPGFIGGGNYYYKNHYYQNSTGVSQCVTITISNTDPTEPVFATAYLNSFDPTNLMTNYLGDCGSNAMLNQPQTFGVNVPNGAVLIIMVMNPMGNEMTKNYTLSVSGLPCRPSCSFSIQLTSASPTLNTRLIRNSYYSTCETVKAYPGDYGGGPYAYSTKTILNNTGTTQCMTISGTMTDNLDGGIFMSAYNGSFDPTNIATNYLGDSGSSPTTVVPTKNFTLKVENGQKIVLVFNTSNSGVYTTTGALQVNVSGITCSGILATEEAGVSNARKAILYPNPTEGILNVKGLEMKSARVFDASGKFVPVGVDANTINVQNLPKGNYIVQIIDKDGNIVIDKFIKK